MAVRRISDTARERVADLRKGYPFAARVAPDDEVNPPSAMKRALHGKAAAPPAATTTTTKGAVKLGGRGPIQRVPAERPTRRIKRDGSRDA